MSIFRCIKCGGKLYYWGNIDAFACKDCGKIHGGTRTKKKKEKK